MDKTVKAIIAVIICVWVFFMGYELGKNREFKRAKNNPAPAAQTTAAPVLPPVSTAAPVQTEAPSTTKAEPAVTAEPQTEKKKKKKEESNPATNAGTAEIIEAVAKAVNDTKNYQGGFTAQFDQQKNLSIVDCSASAITSTVDKLVKEFVGGGDSHTYKFTDGYGFDADGNQITPKDVIPPRFGEKVFSLSEGGVSAAEVSDSAEGKKYKVTLVPETAAMDTLPVYNYTCSGYLDLSTLSIIKSADYSYPGTVIEATVGSNGLLSALHVYMPITATGNGEVLRISAYATFDGNLDENWTFTYA